MAYTTKQENLHTYFAPAARADEGILRDEIDHITSSELINGLMNILSGLLAVLNDKRQIVTLNDTLLQKLGIHDSAEVLGLRPGEALGCIHAEKEPGGCGTSEYCSSCGAAIAIVTALAQDVPVERKCAATLRTDNLEEHVCFKVRACPVMLDNERYILLFLQDITRSEQRVALERIFFHDMTNVASGLIMACDLLQPEKSSENKELLPKIKLFGSRLAKEFHLQQILLTNQKDDVSPWFQSVSVNQTLHELQEIIGNSPFAEKKHLAVTFLKEDQLIVSEMTLLLRILINMVKNGMEAAEHGDTIRVWTGSDNVTLSFYVSNPQPIPSLHQKRIFQPFYSTKEGEGRGFGTYSMKIIGEEIFGGTVSFSSNEHGTIFTFAHPLSASSDKQGV